MTSNYRNSAGTDLDNLFYINNANLGAIGFIMSNGADLGNRYANDQVLGYNVGYKNSAGTDIGYLRGQGITYTHILTVGYYNSSMSKPRYGYDSSANIGNLNPKTFRGSTITKLYSRRKDSELAIVPEPSDKSNIVVIVNGVSHTFTYSGNGWWKYNGDIFSSMNGKQVNIIIR